MKRKQRLMRSAVLLAVLLWGALSIWFVQVFWLDLITPGAVGLVLLSVLIQAGIVSAFVTAAHAFLRPKGVATRVLWGLSIAALGALVWFTLTVRALKLIVWLALTYDFAHQANNAVQFFYSDYSHTGMVFLVLAMFFLFGLREEATG